MICSKLKRRHKFKFCFRSGQVTVAVQSTPAAGIAATAERQLPAAAERETTRGYQQRWPRERTTPSDRRVEADKTSVRSPERERSESSALLPLYY